MTALTTYEGGRPEISEPLILNGKGWWSPELAELCREFSAAEIIDACDLLALDARRSNVPRLREYLRAGEARLK